LTAFVAQVESNWDLFIADLDGYDVHRLTTTPYDEVDPDWAPDQSRIAYASTDGALRIFTVATGEILEIAPHAARTRYVQPDFSPDGCTVAVAVHSTSVEDASDIAVVNLESGQVEIVLAQPGLQLFPRWDAEGSGLFYICAACSTEDGEPTEGIWQVSLDTRVPTEIAPIDGLCQSLELSADGKSLLFSCDRDGPWDLWRLDLDSRRLERLTTSPAVDTDPACSSDGRFVAFTSSREARPAIFILDLLTSEVTSFSPSHAGILACKNPDF
jgi:Tol biopolymer transport system component